MKHEDNDSALTLNRDSRQVARQAAVACLKAVMPDRQVLAADSTGRCNTLTTAPATASSARTPVTAAPAYIDETDQANLRVHSNVANDPPALAMVDCSAARAIWRLIAAGGHGKSDNEAVLTALVQLPARRGSELAERIIAANAEMCPGSCADLLARCARIDSLAAGLVPAGKALVRALPGDPAHLRQAGWAWQRQRIDAGVVVDITAALSRIDATLADAAVGHLLAWPATSGMDDVLLPAVRQLTHKTGTRTLAAVQRLRGACLEHLRGRVALALEAPGDWTRTGAPGCACRRCGELNQFLADTQRIWAFKAAEQDRRHVEETIRRESCDVDCTTDKRGRPYSLVCTKNQARYDRRAEQRNQDLEDLALLQ